MKLYALIFRYTIQHWISSFFFLHLPLNLSSHINRSFSTHFSVFITSSYHSTVFCLFSSLFSCLIFRWWNSFHPSFIFSLASYLISYLSSLFFLFFTNRRIHTLRVKPTEQFIRWNIETVHKRRSLGNRQSAAFTHTHTQLAPRLPTSRPIRCPSVCILPITCLSMFKLGTHMNERTCVSMKVLPTLCSKTN